MLKVWDEVPWLPKVKPTLTVDPRAAEAGELISPLVPEPVRGGFDDAPAVKPQQEPLVIQLRRLLAEPAFRWLCLGCGIAGVSGYGYGTWMPSFLVRSHGLSIAHAGLVFGVASGLGAVAGSLFSGWSCDRLVARDARWQVGLQMLGVLLAVPCALALLLWPGGGAWTIVGVAVPHAMSFALLFGFFASWWPSLSYSAVSQMVPAQERAVAASVLNLFITLFGVGVGPLVTGMLSDLLTPVYGAQALRLALVAVICLMVLTALLFAAAVAPYRQRLRTQAA